MTKIYDEHGVSAIVVGMWNTPKRVQEYMPAKAFDFASEEQVENYEERIQDLPISDQYLQFIVQELKPFIDKKYRTKADPTNTSVLGSSMGGLISLYALCEYPDVFGSAACISTHWPIGDGMMLNYLENKSPDPLSHRVYFDYGTRTLDASYEPWQLQADSILLSKGFKMDVHMKSLKFEGHEHSERDWQKRVEIPLSFLLGLE